MVDIPSRKERFAMHNSLICLVQAIKEYYVTIEMRNGNTVSGKLSHVDGYMNMAMDDAVLITADDKQHFFEYFYLQAKSIKYVTIPQHMDIAQTIMDQLSNNFRSFCNRKGDVAKKPVIRSKKKSAAQKLPAEASSSSTATTSKVDPTSSASTS